MRKLWVKAWIALDGVFDADTMDDWWQNTNSPERMQYIIIMGRGRRSFGDGAPPKNLRLVESKLLSFGSLAFVFRPADN